MKILFIHPNMPGQFKHLAPAFASDKNNQVVFLTKPRPHISLPDVTKIEFFTKRAVEPETHRYLIGFERAVIASQEVWRMCKKLKESGFIPDVIVGHIGFGDGLFLKDIFQDTPVLSLFEYYYHSRGSDTDFIREELMSPDDEARVRMRNAIHLFNLTDSDWGISPTFFQRNQHPEIFHPKISVIHDGIDVDTAKPARVETFETKNKTILTPEHEIVTYISRNFEPYRWFPTFMRAIEMVMKERPNCHVIMVGGDDVSYGRKAPNGKTWRQHMMEEVKLNMERFTF
ncbi:MAG: hypothetical protein KDD76_05355, partial [Rickettsiales bacterium]|nr:hypothetical protein [Rickettsiales bacterium]